VSSFPKEFAVLEDDSGRRLFVKVFARGAAVEYERSRVLFETSKRSQQFRAPEPLKLVEPEGVIIFEYIHGLVGCREYLVRSIRSHLGTFKQRLGLLRRIGRSLASIHDGFATANGSGECVEFEIVANVSSNLRNRILEVLSNSPKRPMHGDFSGGNIFTLTTDGEPSVVVLDPTAHPYLSTTRQEESFGSIYLDAAQFVFSISCHPRFYPPLSREVDQYAEEFSIGYQEESGYNLDRATLLASAATISRKYQEHFDRRRNRFSFSDWRERRIRTRASQRLLVLAEKTRS
jgi:hypothetical protein